MNRRNRRSRSSNSSRRKQEEEVVKSILFYGFQKLHSGVFGRNFDAFPSFRALLFGRGGGAVSELGKLEDGYFSCNFRKQR